MILPGVAPGAVRGPSYHGRQGWFDRTDTLFLNRRRDRVKILFWERDGLVIWYKRLEAGTFQKLDPAASTDRKSGQAGLELTATDLALLLTGIDVTTAQRRKRYARAS